MNSEAPNFNNYQDEINEYHENFDETQVEHAVRARRVFEAINAKETGEHDPGDGKKRIKENLDISYSYLESKGYSREEIDELFYDRTFVVTGKDSNGKPIFKKDENGRAVEEISKERPNLGMEYLLQFDITVPDLVNSGIIGQNEPISAIKRFSDDLYTLTDTVYFPNFNERFNAYPMSIVKEIVDKRRKGEALDERCREFAHACYQDSMDTNSNDRFWYVNDNVANRLLFGGDRVIGSKAKYLLEEAEALAHDSTNDYLDRVCHLENRMVFYRGYVAGAEPKEYNKAQRILHETVWRNLPNIYERVNNLKTYLDQFDEDEYDPDDRDIIQKELHNYGLLMLGNCGSDSVYSPAAWIGEAENEYNKTAYGLGDTMIKCGISPDTILDTYYGGPKRLDGVSYEETYSYLEARRLPDLVRIGIPKEGIVENIRKKNENRGDPFYQSDVRIGEEEREQMRRGGCSNGEIMDAMALENYNSKRGREYYKKTYGFSDEDFVELLLRKMNRIGNSTEE